MSTKRFWIENASQFDGQTVTVKGWVHNKRSSGKIKFLMMRDGTGLMQGIFFKGECDDVAFEEFEKLTQESSFEVTGSIRKDQRSGNFEMGVKSLKIVQVAEPYPITPKEHGVEFLMNHRHLWIRSQKQWAALRIRAEIIRSIQEFFDDQGFIRFDAPILTPTACEGTSTLFSTKYFEEKAYLTQSGQLYGETGAMAFGKIYTFGPTFRAEKSATRKHLTEFWMMEPEVAFMDLQGNMELGEGLIQHIAKSVLKNRAKELQILERDLTKLEILTSGPFPRISYDEALKILEKRGAGIPWGEDFGAPHETALGEEFGKPVFVHHMPASIKAFYFKQSDTHFGPASTTTGKYAFGCDLIAPDGYGEIIGGGQREENVDVLKRRIKEHDLSESDYEWYLDLRKYGSVPHSGFGLGLERMVAWMTGVPHVRETVPYPRMMNTLRP